jgi:hypothetical protein
MSYIEVIYRPTSGMFRIIDNFHLFSKDFLTYPRPLGSTLKLPKLHPPCKPGLFFKRIPEIISGNPGFLSHPLERRQG